jgi:hypothetical protein
MTPQQALTATRRALNLVGEDIAIRRFTGSGSPRPHTDTTTRARVIGGNAPDLVGQITQATSKVIALVDNLSSILPLTTNDKAVIRGKEWAIKSIDDDTRRVGGVLIAIELEVIG